MLNTGLPMLVLWGPELICLYNDHVIPSLDPTTQHPAIGKPSAQIWSQAWPIVGPLLEGVLQSGEPVTFQDVPMLFYRHGNTEEVFWTFCYSAIMTEDGRIGGVLATCLETTQGVRARQQLEQSQQQLLALFEQSPVAIAIIGGDNLTYRLANSFYGELAGRNIDELIGKPMLDALPELRGQGFDALLHGVIQTGVPFTANELAFDVIRQGQLETIYVDMAYKPLRGPDGHISGVFVVATDVSQQVRTRQTLEATSQQELLQANQRLSLAMEAGRLGAYTLDLTTGHMEVSAQYRANYGQPAQTPFNFADLLATIVADDRDWVQQAVTRAVETHTNYSAEYRIVWPDGTRHWVQDSGQPESRGDGQPVRINGVTQEITAQRIMQEELEQQVQQRTRELQVLVADLRRSNENLEQFAYVASHDLQEPLRKIQQFGDLLQGQYSEALGEGKTHLNRMQVAASRMSILIKDLLAFSRIATTQALALPVALGDVIQQVIESLSVAIEESGAQLEVDDLPTVLGDAQQLTQLFQNLLSNALKFRRTSLEGNLVNPQIQVRARLLARNELPALVKPARTSETYHLIEIIDNGIGFEEKYLGRIFQVVQRLHGKNEFAGTGVGLAIVQKVVTNHGGIVTASGKPNQGATFCVYLPA
ncbi:hypothetical protein GCM10027185_62820 [Spirosoma pulveris]